MTRQTGRKPLIAVGLITGGIVLSLSVVGAVVAAGSFFSAPPATTAADLQPDALAFEGPDDDGSDAPGIFTASPTPHTHATSQPGGDVVKPDGEPPKQHHPPAKPTPEERACMADLTAQVKDATIRLQDPEVAKAEGYRFPDDPTKTHMGNRTYVRDGKTLDYAHPETAIYKMQSDGAYRLVGVLFTALKGQGPQPCGNATRWHTHTHCVDGATRKPLDMPGDQACPAGSTAHEGRAEMMHVWFVGRRKA
ncbi:MAG: hypothetical protein HY873_12640 [Chloroflexi bacterium]|nr:hypothetical protein [Chloroflexota bacterium]